MLIGIDRNSFCKGVGNRIDRCARIFSEVVVFPVA